jgi:hypothetical protein
MPDGMNISGWQRGLSAVQPEMVFDLSVDIDAARAAPICHIL